MLNSRRKMPRSVAVAAGLVALGFVFFMATVTQGRSSSVDNFPLWKDIPVHDFAVLHEGRNRHGTRWAVYTYRRPGGGERARTRPCIFLAMISSDGGYGYSTECGPLAPSSGRSIPPIAAGGGSSEGGRRSGSPAGESFWGMTFAAGVRKVEVKTEPGQPVVRQTQYLSAKQSTKAHVARFRYVAFSLARDVCLDSVTGRVNSGAVVLEAGFNECPLEASG